MNITRTQKCRLYLQIIVVKLFETKLKSVYSSKTNLLSIQAIAFISYDKLTFKIYILRDRFVKLDNYIIL